MKQILLFLPNLRRKARIVYLDDGNNILGYVNKKLPDRCLFLVRFTGKTFPEAFQYVCHLLEISNFTITGIQLQDTYAVNGMIFAPCKYVAR